MRERIIDKSNELMVHENRIKELRKNSLEEYINADPVIKYSTERNLQLISDAELDILILLYKKFGVEVAGSQSSLVNSLKSLLSNDLLESFNKRRELRNKLVHVYKEFSFDKEVFEQSKDTKDVDEFIEEVKKIVDKRWT